MSVAVRLVLFPTLNHRMRAFGRPRVSESIVETTNFVQNERPLLHGGVGDRSRGSGGSAMLGTIGASLPGGQVHNNHN